MPMMWRSRATFAGVPSLPAIRSRTSSPDELKVEAMSTTDWLRTGRSNIIRPAHWKNPCLNPIRLYLRG
jgi:hypothetical protein